MMSRNTFLGMLVSVVNCGTVGTVQPDIRLMATMYSTFNGANERLVGNRAHTHTLQELWNTQQSNRGRKTNKKQDFRFSVFITYTFRLNTILLLLKTMVRTSNNFCASSTYRIYNVEEVFGLKVEVRLSLYAL